MILSPPLYNNLSPLSSICPLKENFFVSPRAVREDFGHAHIAVTTSQVQRAPSVVLVHQVDFVGLHSGEIGDNSPAEPAVQD